jgi:2-amino-4-hydroxy-6-hydroxymethyldihydropteridine diphosphokinase
MPSRSRERAYVALGSNLGDRDGHLRTARAALARLPGTALVAASTIEETPPLGGMSQPPYLNQMVVLDTELAPRALLDALHEIENRAGRRRETHWGSANPGSRYRSVRESARCRTRPYHSPSRVAQPRLLAA